MSNILNNVATDVSSGALVFLDKAVMRLKDFGVSLSANSDPAPVVALIQKVASVDQPKALALARVLQQSSAFNEVVRTQVGAQTLSDRYEKISSGFDSIRDDAKMMVEQLDDGKITLGEKAQNTWMRITRGTISDRFDKIRKVYLDVAKDSKEQIEREQAILEAYKDFRVAMKEGEILALQILKQAEVLWNESKVQVAQRQSELDALAADSAPEVRARAELARDQAMREAGDVEGKYQIAKDLAENLKVGYATGEIVMARLQQTTGVKERVYQQAVSFFATNDSVLAALNATFTGLHGLHESTQTLNNMKSGVEKSLEALADVGNNVQMQGIKAGYGPTIGAEPVKKLVNAVVDFQAQSMQAIAEMRKASTQNADEIAAAVEDGQKRYAALMSKAQ